MPRECFAGIPGCFLKLAPAPVQIQGRGTIVAEHEEIREPVPIEVGKRGIPGAARIAGQAGGGRHVGKGAVAIVPVQPSVGLLFAFVSSVIAPREGKMPQ